MRLTKRFELNFDWGFQVGRDSGSIALPIKISWFNYPQDKCESWWFDINILGIGLFWEFWDWRDREDGDIDDGLNLLEDEGG